MSTAASLAPYIVPADTAVAELKASEAFAGLTPREATYAYHLSRASWHGSLINLFQTSVDSVPAFFVLRAALACEGGIATVKARATAAGVSGDDFKLWAAWAASVMENSSTFRGFGDTKLYPGVCQETFEAILMASPSFAGNAEAVSLWKEHLAPRLYDTRPRTLQLGLADTGVSGYYSADMTPADVACVGRWIAAKALDQPYNTRVFKTGERAYQIRLASSHVPPSHTEECPGVDDGATDLLLGTHSWIDTEDGAAVTIQVVRGDYGPVMDAVAAHLRAAIPHAANPTQAAMLEHWARGFYRGSQADFVAGATDWTRDKGPAVETYIGFIESYQDPAGIRGAWEGLVAVVNKVTSARFGELVDKSASLLTLMPWDRGFEKDRFMRPDFTALEVLTFAGGSPPAGINIPNQDAIRQVHGFKNVSLSNVLSARAIDRATFLAEADQARYCTLLAPAFEIQVGIHELLGHGAAKVFMRNADGSLNFEPGTIVHPVTGALITAEQCYPPGATWDSVFGSYASPMEECRAEAVGIYLCVQEEVLRIFGHVDDGDDIVYVNWLNMARAGLLGLQFYNPTTKSWGQAHMQARYVLLNVMLEAGEGLLTIEGLEAVTAEAVAAGTVSEGEGGVHIKLDASKIKSVGVPAVGRFLRALQAYKSTADFAGGRAFFDRYCAVPDAWLPLRELVVAKRKPRGLFVQPVLELEGTDPAPAAVAARATAVVPCSEGGGVRLRTFPATFEGVADAFTVRFTAELGDAAGGFTPADAAVLAAWKAEAPCHAF